MTTNEYLSNDILEEDFMNIFKSYRWIQMVMGSSRVDARDRFVTAPTNYQKFYTVFCSITSASMSMASLTSLLYEFRDYPNMSYLCIAAMTVHLTIYFSYLIHVRFMNNEANVRFNIKLQEIDRLFKIENNKPINDILRRTNQGTVTFVLVVIIVLFSLATTGGLNSVLAFLGITWSEAVTVIELSYLSNLVTYFFIRIRFTNSIIANHLNPPGKMNVKTYITVSKSSLRQLAAQSHNFTTSDTSVYLKELFACYSNFQDIYRFQILLFFVGYVSFVLICFEFGIQMLIFKAPIKAQDWVAILALLTVGFIQAIVLCVRCEAFYSEIKETKRLALGIMSQYPEGPLWRKAKNMVELIDNTPPSFSVYDMWQLDARIMLNVAGVVTTLLVTLLQFALL